MKVHIQYQDQWGIWKHLTTQHHEPSAYKTAVKRADNTGKRHRLVDDNGTLIDLINP